MTQATNLSSDNPVSGDLIIYLHLARLSFVCTYLAGEITYPQLDCHIRLRVNPFVFNQCRRKSIGSQSC